MTTNLSHGILCPFLVSDGWAVELAGFRSTLAFLMALLIRLGFGQDHCFIQAVLQPSCRFQISCSTQSLAVGISFR